MDLGDGWLSCAPKPVPPKRPRPKHRQTVLLKKSLVKKTTAKPKAAFSTDNDYDDFQEPKERKPKRTCSVQQKISFKKPATSKPSSSKITSCGRPNVSRVSPEATEKQHDVDTHSGPAEGEGEEEAAISDMPSWREAGYRLDTAVGDASVTRNTDETRTSQRRASTSASFFERPPDAGAVSTHRHTAALPEDIHRESTPDPQHDSPTILSAEPRLAETYVGDGMTREHGLHGGTSDPDMINLLQDSQPYSDDCLEQHRGIGISSQESTFSVVRCASWASSSAELHFTHHTRFEETDAPVSPPLPRYRLPERENPDWGFEYTATQSQDLMGRLPDTQQLLEEDEEYMRRKRAVQSGLENLPSVASLRQLAQHLAGQNSTLA